MRQLTWGALIASLVCCSVQAENKPKTYRSITWKKFTESGPELKQLGWMTVRHAKEIESSDWSVGCETLDRDQAKFSVYRKFVGELGAKYGRIQSGWAKCEKTKGQYEFAWLDECVNGLHEEGVQPWMCLCYGNPIYGSSIRLGSSMAGIIHSEEAFAAWLKYVEIVVTRYKDSVQEWEIWNEPFGQGADYAVMVLQTAEVIRKVQPDAIIHVTHAKDSDRITVLEALKKADKLDLVKYWDYHPYQRNPDESYAWVEKFQKVLASYNPNYKLHQGECGCPSILEWTHALSNYPWTEYSQAKWDLRRLAGDRVRDIRSSVFTIIDLKYYNMLQSFGLIRSNLLLEFIYKRPSYYGVQHMMSFFDNAVQPIGVLKCESDSPRTITVAGFEKAKTCVALLWYSDEIPSDDLVWDKVDVKVEGLSFTDPVYVEMITGKIFELPQGSWKSEGTETTLKQLPVWDSPMMLVERGQIGMRQEGSP